MCGTTLDAHRTSLEIYGTFAKPPVDLPLFPSIVIESPALPMIPIDS